MLPEPASDATDPARLFVRYLDYFRGEVVRKLTGLDDGLDISQVPSGWTPRQLLNHLVHMERRWFVWGYLGEDVENPRDDRDSTGAWQVDADLDVLVEQLVAGGRRTSSILSEHALDSASASTGMFADADDVPTLLAIAFHVLQEYARHAGHLDIVRELTDGLTGEG